MSNPHDQITARLATLDQLEKNVLPNFFDPVPPRVTLREWFRGVPKFKANQSAKRGGGPVYYSVSAIETLIKSRTLVS